MAKAINYIINDGTLNQTQVTLADTNTVIDNNWTNITNYGALLSGVKVRYAVKFDPAVIDSSGRCFGGTEVATYGNSTAVTPGVGVLDLGSPLAVDTAGVHAAITLGLAPSATGVHAAITLAPTSQIIASGFTNPSGRYVTIVGNDTDMLDISVSLAGTDLNSAVIGETLELNGTTTVKSTLIYNTITSVTVPPYLVDGSETVSVGTGDIATNIGITNPDVGRTVTITGSASGITGNVIIVGSYKGIPWTATIAANGTSTIESTHVFDDIESIEVPTKTNSSGDTIVVGFGDKIALGVILTHPTIFMVIEGTTAYGLGEATTFTMHGDPGDESLNYITFYNASDGTARRVYFVIE
jgi:hypothetical protein